MSLTSKPLTYTYPADGDGPRLVIEYPVLTVPPTELPRTPVDRHIRTLSGPPMYTIDGAVVDRDTFVEAWVAAGSDANEVP